MPIPYETRSGGTISLPTPYIGSGIDEAHEKIEDGRSARTMITSKKEPDPVLLWFRKDLRLDDNHALHAAAISGRPVIPIYIREPEAKSCGPLGAAQEWWLHHSLAALQKALGALNSQLILRQGDAQTVLEKLLAETGAASIVWNRRYDPAGIAVDTQVKKALRDSGIEAGSFAGQLLHEPSRLRTGTGTPYKTYTPFWRALELSGEPPCPIEAPEKLEVPEHWPDSGLARLLVAAAHQAELGIQFPGYVDTG